MTKRVEFPPRVTVWSDPALPNVWSVSPRAFAQSNCQTYIRADCIEDELLSLATDEEADAIRAAMARVRADRNGV